MRPTSVSQNNKVNQSWLHMASATQTEFNNVLYELAAIRSRTFSVVCNAGFPGWVCTVQGRLAGCCGKHKCTSTTEQLRQMKQVQLCLHPLVGLCFDVADGGVHFLFFDFGFPLGMVVCFLHTLVPTGYSLNQGLVWKACLWCVPGVTSGLFLVPDTSAAFVVCFERYLRVSG